MIYGIGTDMIEISRTEKAIAAHAGFLARVYTEEEIAYCREKGVETFAGRFAAKEAILKALGHGANGWFFTDMEILPDTLGKPVVFCYGPVQEYMAERGINKIHLSIAHSRELATAYAVAEVMDL